MARTCPESRSSGTAPALLAHRRVVAPDGRPNRWVLFLHGFLGAGRNWASIGRDLVQARPDWGVVLVDLRLHGDSQGFAPPHTVASSSADVNSLILHLEGRETVIVGHSFGGKVALACVRSGGPGVRQVWVADSTPAAGRTEAGANRLMAVLSRLPDQFESRAHLISAVESAGFNADLARWTATNLKRGPDGYRWRFDLSSLDLLLESFYREDLWPIVESPPAGTELLFLRATRGSILDDASAARIARLEADGERVRLIEIEGGHWLNMSNPRGLLDLLVDCLPR